MGAERADVPGVVRLLEGQRVLASNVMSGQEGALLVWVQGQGWDPTDLKTCPVLSAGMDADRIEIDAAGVEIVAQGELKRLDLPPLSRDLEHLIAVRWKAGKVELWLDARAIASLDKIEFGEFSGLLKCYSPTKEQAPYRILSASLFRSAVSDADLAEVMRSSDFSNDPLAVVPLVSLPPVLDGKLSEEEWKYAAVLSGLHDSPERSLAQTQGHFHLMYDASRLYVGYRGAPPVRLESGEETQPEAQALWQAQESRDSRVEEDDCLELTLRPEFPGGDGFRLLTNHWNTRRDAHWSSERGTQLGWQPEWDTATGLDGRDWIVEASIPWRAFGRPAPRPGETWGANFTRIWRWLQDQQDEWATGTRLRGRGHVFRGEDSSASAAVGRIRFAGREALVTRILDVQGFEKGAPSVKLELLNLAAENRDVRVRLESNCGEIEESREMTVPALLKKPLSFSGKLTRANAYAFTVRVEDAQRELLHLSRFHFRKPPRIQCTARYFPSYERFELQWDLSQLGSVALERLTAEIHFVHRPDNKIAMSHGVKELGSYFHQETIPTAKLPTGDYVVVALVGMDRQEVGRTVHVLAKRPRPEWLGNEIGLKGQVPPPFEPVRVKGVSAIEGRKVEVVGRVYDFGRAALPDQIYVGGEPILAAPIRLLAEHPGGRARDISRDLVWGKAGGNPIKFDFLHQRPDRIEWQSLSLLTDVVRPGVSGWAEYDGLVWLKAEVRGEKWPGLKSLRLEIPLRKEWATLVNNFDRGLMGTGALPEAGVSKRWEPIWIGNERGGIQWLTESYVTWRLQDPQRAIRVIPRREDTLLQVTFVDHETAIPQGFQAEFGLIATPVRPAGDWSLAGDPSGGQTWARGNYEPPSTDTGNPMAWPTFAYGKEVVPHGADGSESAKGRELAPQVMLSVCRAGRSAIGQKMLATLGDYFFEWAASRREKWRPGPQALTCSPASKSWQDFMVWTYAEMHARKPYAGLYIDHAMPVFSDNLFAGAGVQDRGQVYPKWTLLGTREMLKRLYTMLKAREPKSSVRLNLHGRLLAPLMGFCDMVVDGEGLDARPSAEEPATFQRLSLPMFRAQYLGTNFGPRCSWTPPNVLNGDVDRESRWLAGIALLHRVNLDSANRSGQCTQIRKAISAGKLSSESWRFIGYWQNPPVRVEPERKGLVISAYIRKKAEDGAAGSEALLVILNSTDWEGELKVLPDWGALGASQGEAKVRDAESGQVLKVAESAFRLTVKPRDVHLVSVSWDDR